MIEDFYFSEYYYLSFFSDFEIPHVECLRLFIYFSLSTFIFVEKGKTNSKRNILTRNPMKNKFRFILFWLILAVINRINSNFFL